MHSWRAIRSEAGNAPAPLMASFLTGESAPDVSFAGAAILASAVSESETIFAEFESLGEAEVEERLALATFDSIRRAYAQRWLNQKGADRFQAAEREAARKKADQDRIRRRAQAIAYAVLVAAVMALVIAFLVSHRTFFG